MIIVFMYIFYTKASGRIQSSLFMLIDVIKFADEKIRQFVGIVLGLTVTLT